MADPEFDANERESWYRKVELENAICPHCGNLKVVCSNPDGIDGVGYYPQRTVCWVTAARDRSIRMFAKLHEKAQPDAAGYLPYDGAFFHASLTDDTPDDDFLEEGALLDLIARMRQVPGDGDQSADHGHDSGERH